MNLLLSSSSMVSSSHVNPFKVPDLVVRKTALLDPHFTSFDYNIQQKLFFANKNITKIFQHKSPSSKCMTRECMNSSNELFVEESRVDDRVDQEDGGTEDIESPWEGAILYQRNPPISHLEYCTTLERLGLEKLSTEVSKSRASLMGLRVAKSIKDFPLGTPVLISVDVTRKKQRLRLDGIIRTVITLGCNRCGEAAAECVFSNFSLLLTEEPIEEPEIINMGMMFGQDKFRTSICSEEEEEGDEASIDLDDWLFFPPQEKVVDISKHIRDMVHLEITINALCDPTCKGLCLNCGTNLNTSSCKCSKQKMKDKGYGPLGGLKEQMQQ